MRGWCLWQETPCRDLPTRDQKNDNTDLNSWISGLKKIRNNLIILQLCTALFHQNSIPGLVAIYRAGNG